MDIHSIKSSQTQNMNLPVVDSEWLQLLLEARAIGLSIDDIKAFLKKQLEVENEQKNFNVSNNEHS